MSFTGLLALHAAAAANAVCTVQCCLATRSPLGALLIVQSRGFGQSFQSYRYTALDITIDNVLHG